MTESLLLIVREGEMRSAITEALSGTYRLLLADSWEEGVAILLAQRRALSAVLVELELALRNRGSFARELRGDDSFSPMPVLGVVRDVSEIPDMDCFEHGVFDIITCKTPPQVMLRRIRSAVSSADSLSFREIEKLLKALPSCIYLKDTEGRYVFNTHYWHHIRYADEPGWSIRGRTDLEIRKNRENARRAMAADRLILESGEGLEYLMKEDSDGIIEYLEIVKRPVFGEDGKINGIVGLVSDVTEKQLLKMELEKRAQVDRLTELLNKTTTEDLIGMRLNFARKNNKCGAVILLDVDNFKAVNDSFGHAVGDRVLAGIGKVIRNSFRGIEVAGRIGGDEFIIYAEDIYTADAAMALAKRISAQVADGIRECPVTFSAGIALFPEHGSCFEDLYKAADAAMYTVKKDGKASCKLFSGWN